MYVHVYECKVIYVIHVYECKVICVHCTYTFMIVNVCMYIVQTRLRLYSSTTTLHFSAPQSALRCR